MFSIPDSVNRDGWSCFSLTEEDLGLSIESNGDASLVSEIGNKCK